MGLLAYVVEALGSIVLPCSATVVVPALLVAVTGRGRWPVVAAVATGIVAGGVTAVVWAPAVADVAVGVGLGLGGWAVHRATRPRRSAATGATPRWARAAGPAGGLVVGLAAGSVWYPCVGLHLGTVITTALRTPSAAVPALALYLAILALPAVVVAVLARARPVGRRLDRGPAATIALVVLVGLALGATVGWADDVAAMLFRWST